MHKSTVYFRNHILGVLLLISIFSFNIVTAQSSADSSICKYPGTVFQIESDIGGFQILLDNGVWITPHASTIPDFFSDSLRVRVDFEYVDSLISPCLSCNWVYLTCAMMIVDPPECKARFEAHQLATIASTDFAPGGYSYEFVDVSFGSVLERVWFIDGDSIFGEEVITHIFYESGYHTVCLAIQTKEGCYDQYCMELYVGGGSDCYADFGYYPLDGIIYTNSTEDYYVGFPYQFYDKSFGEVINWEWTFGNDVISEDSIPVYSFPSQGAYEVCLTITTSDNCISTQCKTVIVGPPNECQAMFEYYNPLDLMPTEPWTDFPGSRVMQFVDMSKGDITNWHWSFGDGTNSYEQSPIHEFPHAGAFEVCLTVASPDSCIDTYCTIVYIQPTNDCKAYFEYCSYHINLKDSLYNEGTFIIGFNNLSYPDAVYSEWSFGDGTYSTERNPIHVYVHPGVFEVCLSIYTSIGCFDTYCLSVYAGIEDCKVDFTHEIAVPDCWGFETAHYFTAITIERPWAYYWDFGDGHFATGAEVAHIYAHEGFYDVCLDVTYSNGCVARNCKVIYNSVIVNDSVFFEKCNPSNTEFRQSDQGFSVTNVYPIPAFDVLNIEVYSDNSGAIDISLINTLGQKISLSENYNVSAGENQLELHLGNLEPGTYIYVISSSDKIIRGRVSIIQ